MTSSYSSIDGGGETAVKFASCLCFFRFVGNFERVRFIWVWCVVAALVATADEAPC